MAEGSCTTAWCPTPRAKPREVTWSFTDEVTETPLRETPDQIALEVSFCPDPTIWDGRFANNGWLQELPKPLTKLTWDNAAIVSPANCRTARRFES